MKNERQPEPTPNVLESSSRPQRERQLPARYQDCVMGHDNDPSDEEIIKFALFAGCESISFGEALNDENWRNAMDDEISAIKKNDT